MGLTVTPAAVLIQDEGVAIGSASTMNFVGGSVTATVSAGTLTATITDTAMSIGIAILMQQTNYNQ